MIYDLSTKNPNWPVQVRCQMSKNQENVGWLVVWNINFIFPLILGISSSQLTNSIIFQDGVALAHQPVGVSKKTRLLNARSHRANDGHPFIPIIPIDEKSPQKIAMFVW